jgi:uncharacterized RDD family membrane protein YckC
MDDALEPRPAGLARRLGAMIYDALLVLAIWMFTLFPVVALHNDYVFGALVQSFLFVEMFAFFAWSWVHRGQTVGMMAWRLKVVSDDGGNVTLMQATFRFMGALVSFVCLGLGYLWIWIDGNRRSWSDLASASRVLVEPSPKHRRHMPSN